MSERERFVRFRLSDEFASKDEVTLYHYCGVDSFKAILESRKLRMSDINLTNDQMEGRWGYNVFIEAANLVLKEVGKEFIESLDKIISESQLALVPYLCCFSTEGDMLSQWRAYADDGVGVAIGFSSELVDRMPVRASAVIYDKEVQVARVCEYLKFMKHCTEQDEFKDDLAGFLFQVAANLSAELMLLKNPAFHEEKEIRFLHLIDVEFHREPLRVGLSDQGGSSKFEERIAGAKVQFRIRQGLLCPFVEYEFGGPAWQKMIKKVILGPRNPNSATLVSILMTNLGYVDFRIERSRVSYRA